jgi:hypothetical protein
MKFSLHARNTISTLSLLILSAAPLVAVAGPPATSPYVTDAQNTYVHDATSNGLDSLNLVLCVLHSMDPAAMVNKGPYIALVDMNKCDPRERASASNSTAGASGATSAPNYMTAVIDVTRAGAADPMIGKVWMSMTEQGQPLHVYAHLSATQSPTDAPPYGQFRMDYISEVPNGSGGTTMSFNGFVNANGPKVSFLDTGPQSNHTALTMTAASSTAGSGTMKTTDQGTGVTTTFNFAYDGSEPNFAAGVFRRDEGTTDVCFDRAKAKAERSVWRYGTYNANDGTRVDQAHPGFPITATYSGKTYQGYAGYWGIDLQGLDLSNLKDGLISGAKIEDQRPGNTNTYLLSKVSGKLTKWTEHQKTLADMDGIPFSFWGDLTGQTANTSITTGTWQMHWDKTAGKFIVTGKQTCGSTGCVLTSLSSPAAVTGTLFDNMPIAGWSDAFGGNINIPFTNSAHTGADTVSFYSQEQVIPGSAGAPKALYCVSHCPTATSIGKFKNKTATSPFDPTTATQWGGSGSVSETYSFDSGGLKQAGTPMVVTASSVLTGQYRDGITTGKLFANPLTSCPSGVYCEPANATTYYTWQTGTNQWNQSRWLTRTSNSTVVSFDPPEAISYTVPSGSGYGKWAGKKLLLQFDGFGNLDGIPGDCVSNTDNTPESCSTPGARYVPAFAIPDGTTMTLTLSGTNTPLIVKALDMGLRLSKINGCTGVALSQSTTTATLPPKSDLHDPTSSTDIDYIGTEPTVTSPPKVIDGVVQ